MDEAGSYIRMSDDLIISVSKLSKLGAAYRAYVFRAKKIDAEGFFVSALHRTYPWYVLALKNGLEECVKPRRPLLSEARSEAVKLSARQTIAAIRTLFLDDALAPNVPLVIAALKDIAPTPLAFERLTYYLIAELQVHLASALLADDGRRGAVGGKATPLRRSARDRSALPDPSQPAWATMNRAPAKKVQIPCRIDPAIKELIGKDAETQGMSQSRWLEEAIAEKLQRQGYAVELPKAGKPQEKNGKRTSRPRRTQRRSIPEPDKSPDASVNRADQPTTVRVSKALMSEIDKARGKQNRSRWMNEAVTAFVGENAALPEPPGTPEVLSEPIGLRFDKEFFTEISGRAEKSGETVSEWFRRVARWYLEENQRDSP